MTLASMAAIEDFFEVDAIQDAMAQIGDNPGSKQVAAIIQALTIGQNETEFSIEEVRSWPLEVGAIQSAMEALTAGTGGEPEGNQKARRAAPKK